MVHGHLAVDQQLDSGDSVLVAGRGGHLDGSLDLGLVLRCRGERDGVLMFGYSVGKDGVDDGGNKNKDDCFPLYGPVEAPVIILSTPTKPF